MLLRSAFAALALAAALQGCATPTVYQPAAKPGAVGYTETPIEDTRYRIAFTTGTGGDAGQAFDFALLRAADLTLERGFEWFVVDDRYGAPPPGGGASPRVSVGGGVGSFGGGGGVSLGVGVSRTLGGAGAAVTVEIRMGKGVKPQGPGVYDAAGVRATIGARL